MERQYVESSMLRSIGYDSLSSTLEIEFLSGPVWQYFDFSEYEWYNFLAADSKGKYFRANILKKYPESQVG